MVAPSSAILLNRKDEELMNYQINQPLRLFPVEGASPAMAFSPSGSISLKKEKIIGEIHVKSAIYVVRSLSIMLFSFLSLYL